MAGWGWVARAGASGNTCFRSADAPVACQVVNVSRLEGEDSPVQLIYFVEDRDGERLSAVASSDLINKIDLQRAAIILGYRIQGAIAQRKFGPVLPAS